MEMGTYNGYKIYLSDKPSKKYYAMVNNRKVYFGGHPLRYQHYYDRLGHYSYLNHFDQKRRDKFRSRFRRCKDVVGSPCYFAWHILW